MKSINLWKHSTQENIEEILSHPLVGVILNSFDAFGIGDYEQALTYMTEDVKFHICAPSHHPIGGIFTGHQEILQFLKTRKEMLLTIKLSFDKTIVRDNMVFILGTEEAKVMPREKIHQTDLGLFFLFEGQKIKAFYRFFDSADMMLVG
ncbi:nuclear transport factor 2 family protein [Candidatus Albibeggiatoa sp. nov. BB20]|uniref:nuclear transport factor 2 family protein n=1 Tax=Candidatus Albibeggiatoa sp. nov. BB20 TaxID=3162723 RepID=UPI0033656EE0